ncbi:PBP1A family penicillin-binding protein [Rhodoferax ferrireducens]|uniref:penicillin-binding protein 1A n=1 Tax=Rhodoferax ferrireducens TaxID=192843 RepID=UPI00298EB7CC|nr:PBP1A family penicillin-binding protein [Rhodoferax ferrireducens]WPC67892.1 PBP1A family penicillin-binding protein [Rhodoferax ferrireducens]
MHFPTPKKATWLLELTVPNELNGGRRSSCLLRTRTPGSSKKLQLSGINNQSCNTRWSCRNDNEQSSSAWLSHTARTLGHIGLFDVKHLISPFLCRLVLLWAVALPFASAATPLDLPNLDALMDYRPKIPLRVYTSDNVLIGEFGQERRDVVAIKDIPLVQKQALLAIEDSRFYEHGGVDFKGMARAVIADLSGGLKQGASTITMQVARDFFLTKEKLFSRKVTEVMLAYKIERALTKDQILELYMNQIYMGQRTYGFGSAARVYFGKALKDLSIAQAAMLAGLPQAPSSINPVANPKGAKARQHLVLRRMRDLGYINEAQYKSALQENIHTLGEGQSINGHAQFVAEMVRQTMYAQFKEETYTRGISVITTLVQSDQEAAYDAVRRNVMAFDQRHSYRGPEALVALPRNTIERQKSIEATLQQHPASDKLLSAVTIAVTPKSLRAILATGDEIQIGAEGLRRAAAALAPTAPSTLKIKPGSVIRVVQDSRGRWSITQLPVVGAAFVALNNQTGAYRALVGGFDFNASQLNHVTQAWRQPGSAIKPFIYSAALEKGFSPGTLVNDVPLTLSGLETGGQPWQPQNDDDVYDGPITLRVALAQSKNVAAVRLLRAITPKYAHDFLPRFGFDATKQPVNYTLALGTGSVTPLQMAQAYSVFANGGFQVNPHLIKKVVDTRGTVLFEAKPAVPAQETARVLDARKAFIIDSMLHEVTSSGTGAAASQKLGRQDLAGKTGTSSQAFDGWFAGYSGDTTAVAWMGYDEPRSLGGREFGATLALPIWIDFMRVTLAGMPLNQALKPAGVTQSQGDWMLDEFLNTGAIRTLDLDAPQALEELASP